MRQNWTFDARGRMGGPLLEFRGPWSPEIQEAWQECGRPPLLWDARKGLGTEWIAESAVTDLAIIGALEDDLGVEAASSLESLRLLNAARAPLDWSRLTKLREFHGYDRSGTGFSELPLQTLVMVDLLKTNLEEVPLASLRRLRLTPARRLADLSKLASAAHLEDASLGFLRSIDFTPLGALPRLRRLELIQCRGLTDIEDLSEIAGLEVLELESCSKVESLLPLVSHTNLHVLLLRGSTMPRDGLLADLLNMPSLRRLAVERLPKTADIGRQELDDWNRLHNS